MTNLMEKKELAGKPGSVVDSHSSGTPVAKRLMRPTREQCGQHYRSPIWPYSGWGLPCHGMLPPARGALTAPFHPYRSPEMNQEDLGGIFSVALSIGSRRPTGSLGPPPPGPAVPPLPPRPPR